VSQHYQEQHSKRFQELCRIQSPSLDERSVGDFVTSELDGFGFDWYEDEAAVAIGGNQNNIICKVPGERAEESILVAAHLDTVPPGSATDPLLKEGRWSNAGDGILGVDNKAAVAAILTALEVWSETPPAIDVFAVFTVAEEISLLGAQQLQLPSPLPLAGFVFDHPTPIGTVISNSPSHHTIELEFTGASAHAGVAPEAGASAIEAAATAVALCPGGRLDPVTTSNFGVIEGGSAINVVPEKCRVLAEIRSQNPETLTSETRRIVDAAHEGAGKHGCAADVTVRPSFKGYQHTDGHAALGIGEAALRSLGIEPERISSAGGSDANVFEVMGVPSLNLGDGSTGTHTDAEAISEVDLQRLVDLVLALPVSAACK
jgi:tripeptide aminopeptidase